MLEILNLPIMLSQQEKRFQGAFALMQQACNPASAERVFPGAVLAVTHGGALVALKAFGRFTYEASSPEVLDTTPFDLASVSKAVATTSMAMLLFEKGLLPLDAPVRQFLPEFATGDPKRECVTVRMLLAHSAGLPAWQDLYHRHQKPLPLLQEVATTPLAYTPMSLSQYSDLGFILLGVILERLEGASLASFCQHAVFEPLGMRSALYNPPPELRAKIPPTMNDTVFRRRVIQGEVNDENASVLGGVAGHAGLFANAADLSVLAECLLHGGLAGRTRLFRESTVELFTARQSLPRGTSRALGWDTPSQPSQSGRYFGPRSFGHLGHTGCSLWCDPARHLSITLLGNRTWPDRANERIKQFRPLLHDAVARALDPALA
jgi:CubicO group peptidase (beta-lactamase class C family)